MFSVVALLVGALLVAGYVILRTQDYNRYKGLIIEAVRDGTGRQLAIDGDIQLSVSLAPVLSLNNVTFANAPWGTRPQMLSIQRVEARVRLLPLLFGDWVLMRVALSGTDLLLETDASGQGNWQLEPADISAAKTLPIRDLRVKLIRIEDLSFAFHNGQTSSTTRFRLSSLDASEGSSAETTALRLGGDWNGLPVALSGEVARLGEVLARKRVPMDLSGEVGGAKLKLKGAIADLLELQGVDVRVNVSGANLTQLGGALEQSLPDTGPFQLSGRLRGSTQSLALQDAKATVSHRTVNLSLEGDIANLIDVRGIDLTLKSSGKNLAELRSMTGVQLPDLGPFNVTGRVTGSRAALALDGFSARVDQSDGNGSLKLEFRKRPKLTVRLASGLIDFTPLMKGLQAEEDQARKDTGAERSLFADERLPFDTLQAVDADVALNARRIHVHDAELEFGRLSLLLEEGELRVPTFEANYRQTKVSGSLEIKAGRPPTVATKFLVQGFDIGRFLRETHATETVDGQVDIAAHLTSQGDSPRGLVAKLNGTIGAVMGPGRAPQLLDLLASGLSRRVVPFWGGHKHLGELKCGVVQFDIADGIAASRAFWFKTKLAILNGAGEINLPEERLNFLLSPKPRKASLLSLSTTLRVSGSLADPKVRSDAKAIAEQGAKGLGTLAVGPFGLLAPFAHLGGEKKHPCDVKALELETSSSAT